MKIRNAFTPSANDMPHIGICGIDIPKSNYRGMRGIFIPRVIVSLRHNAPTHHFKRAMFNLKAVKQCDAKGQKMYLSGFQIKQMVLAISGTTLMQALYDYQLLSDKQARIINNARRAGKRYTI